MMSEKIAGDVSVNLCSTDIQQSDNTRIPSTNETILDKSVPKKIVSVVPRERQNLLKWNGWGYKDSQFIAIEPKSGNGEPDSIMFSGDRYPIGNQELPYFKNWVQNTFDLVLTNNRPAEPLPSKYPDPVVCSEFLDDIKQMNIPISTTGIDRLIRSHGQTLADVYNLRTGAMSRIPDIIVWPLCHEDVVHIVKKANDLNVVIIPFGGGTSVSGSITCPNVEQRSIVVLDTTQMNRMMWLDRANMVACFESGIIGQDLERELRKEGLTVGHEPDSYEFSTLGGWVATRASGMKKNVYGNIEDLVVRVKMVTAKGVLERNCNAPRVSIGPDFNQIILGSEGTLGVITEVVLKVRKLPPVKQYGSLVFGYFENGIQCLREIAENRLQPASIRLLDNDQFQFGQALKGQQSIFHSFIDGLKKGYLTKIKGFDLTKMCVATLLFEGRKADIDRQEKEIIAIAAKYGGISAGATNGERGYLLTFVIAYIRDLALEYFIVAESFETSVPWAKCAALCQNTKARVRRECALLGLTHCLISCRITQTYDAGAAVYFYFAFNYSGIDNPVQAYERIEDCAREEILACGGSLSHHHGVGKLRSKWYAQSVSGVGVRLYRAAKTELDPNNIFATGNLLPDARGADVDMTISSLPSKL